MNLKKNRVLKDNHTVKEIKITMFIKATQLIMKLNLTRIK